MTSEIRRRKNKEHQNGSSVIRKMARKDKKNKNNFRLQRSFLCLVISASVLIIFITLYMDDIPWHVGHRAVDRIAFHFGYYKPVHAVIIDAGSTGSRVLAFTFHESYLNGQLMLDKELFVHTKPGLSHFVDTPHKAVESINSLLEKAKDEIPREYWNKTPLVLKATAGLRLLPAEKAENLLNSVRALFKKTPFLTDEHSVSIMDGTDEGIFSWFTVNFLLERMAGNPEKTVAALDLGGGSTQVTFSPTTPHTLAQKENIHYAISPHGQIPVFTHSYLGLGLMAARKEIVTHEQINKTSVNSLCINPIIKNRKWVYGGVEYLVSGLSEAFPTKIDKFADYDLSETVPIVSFEDCSSVVVNYVKSMVKPLAELQFKKINAFSYYFDRATDAALIDEKTGGRVIVEDFKRVAKDACNDANADQPFTCLDLTFIWALLEHGLGLPPQTNIMLFKKINGHEISWALGAAYDILKNTHSAT